MASKRIFISKTKSEWEIIDSRLKEMNKSDLSNYLRSGILKLKGELEKRSNCNKTTRIERQPSIPTEMYDDLRKISIAINKPVASIINDYLITPLLHPMASVPPNSF